MDEGNLMDVVGLYTRLARLEHQYMTKVMGPLEQKRLYDEIHRIRYVRLPKLGLEMAPIGALTPATPGPSIA